MKSGAGFTLIELLVSIAVLSIMGLLILNIFSRSIKGGNKAQIMMNIKQNGQALLENMDKTIRGADNVVCLDHNPEGKTMVIVKNGRYTRYQFVDQTSDENGKILQDNPDPALTEINPANPTVCYNNNIPDAVVLSDTDVKTGVSVTEGFFIRDKQTGFKDVITVKFKVAQGIEVNSDVTTAIEPVEFKTTVQLR